MEEELLLSYGDVYISSPSAFAHAVHRGRGGAGDGDEEAVAVQLRIAVPAAAMHGFEKSTDLMRVVAESLSGGEFRLPDFEEVLKEAENAR